MWICDKCGNSDLKNGVFRYDEEKDVFKSLCYNCSKCTESCQECKNEKVACVCMD